MSDRVSFCSGYGLVFATNSPFITIIILYREAEVITVDEVAVNEAVEDEVDVVDVEEDTIKTNTTSQKRNLSWTSANIWKRKYAYDSTVDGKVIHKILFWQLETKQVSGYCFSLLLVVGTLMGYDPLLNLVLDNTVEYLKGKTWNRYVYISSVLTFDYYYFFIIDLETDYVTSKTRELGLAVLRGTAVILISPLDGMEEIENPFAQ